VVCCEKVGPDTSLIMTIDDIRSASSDDALYNLIARELESRLPPRQPIDEFLKALQGLPPGLHAMAATYELDVSICLDDLGWHFGNWHHVGLALETIKGLRELGAERMAEIVEGAFQLAQRYWMELGSPNWSKWYHGSPLENALASLTNEAYAIWEKQPLGLFSYWLSYARQYPERLVDDGAATSR
jgi:hypothetical protein